MNLRFVYLFINCKSNQYRKLNFLIKKIMKTKRLLFTSLLCGAALVGGNTVMAQDAVVVEDQTVTISENPQCKDYVASNWRNNWFLQIGAGMNMPMVENYLTKGEAKRHITLAMNLGFGHWFSPYLALRFSALGGAIHWDQGTFMKAKYANLNMDLMWDMFNSIGGINTKRVFSIVPFVGIGGTYVWQMKEAKGLNIASDKGGIKDNTFALPVSAGLQFRFRLGKYVDFFAEGRAQFMGDNFNGYAYGQPIDVNLTAIGGFTFNFGGKKFDTMNPCTYMNYINQLNGQVNNLRSELASTSAALAAAEAQLPCPEVKQQNCPEVAAAPMLSAVRFTINSSKISKEEMVNIYNVAEWMKANPNSKLVVNGYADKGTGTSAYNQKLSEKRAQNVYDQLVKYGVDKSRLSIESHGSATQPYAKENNWNRIVLFTTDK